MKTLLYIVVVALVTVIFGCNSTTKPVAETNPNAKNLAENKPEEANDTVRISNLDMGYEVIIIDVGFRPWLQTTAKPRNYYSQNYLESRNVPWVVEWNNRARSPKSNHDAELYLLQIDYQNGTDYGYEVNYLLYNYLVYFQIKNNIRLGGFPPRP
ncbi:MAG TPA: DUF6146 family protein [Flavobacterium sp.]|uniref:DUF6146 family protein n=1 Tax=Flavobacterium sp. TaxID=239 RepID=UPI002C6A110F|nr:DUF6146 family protein [Flavobacterium sp.]HSD15377.1 DUF6146 family protein [Flavobacterium sp.]